jgi:transposase-like protein
MRGKKNINFDEEQKKDILDRVASSKKPTAEILRELGISRSTYYSWLSRYQSEGEAGLKDGRTTHDVHEETVQKPPVEMPENATEATSSSAPPERRIEPESASKKAVASPPASGTKKEGSTSVSRPAAESSSTPPPARESNSSSFPLVATIAIILIVAGLVVGVCVYNSSKYFIVQDGTKISLWKGKFAPFGREKVKDFAPIDVGDLEVNPMTDKTYYGEWSAVSALFDHMIEQADKALEGAQGPDYAKANRYLALAEKVAYKGEQKTALNKRYAQLYFTLSVKKVSQTEQQLLQVYEDSIQMLQHAQQWGFKNSGLLQEEIATLQAKLQELKSWNTDFKTSWLSKKMHEEAFVDGAGPEAEEPVVAKEMPQQEGQPAQVSKEAQAEMKSGAEAQSISGESESEVPQGTASAPPSESAESTEKALDEAQASPSAKQGEE